MSSLHRILVLASVAALAAAPVGARDVKKREHRQERRIEQGEKSGRLSKKEASKLESREQSMHAQEQQMRAENGGKLTKHDRKVLNHEENHLSHQIYRNKHDENGH